MNPGRFGIGLALTCLTLPFGAVVAASIEIAAEPDALVKAMRGRSIVLLGEVHDNAAQHALRAAALRQLVAEGARPAIAFEQFDRERQADIDRARRERPGDADYLIAQGKGAPSWNWPLYRPFVQLALDHDLPIVAANLSRSEAMRLAMDAAATGAGSSYAGLAADFRRAHEDMIATGPLQPAAGGGAAGHGRRAGRPRPHAGAGARALGRARRGAAHRQRPRPHRHRRTPLADRRTSAPPQLPSASSNATTRIPAGIPRTGSTSSC